MHLPLLPIDPAALGAPGPPDNHRSSPVLLVLAKVFLPAILAPAVALYLLNKLRKLGSRRLRRQKTSKENQFYARVWHGWVEREKYSRQKQRSKRFKHYIIRKLTWKTTTTDYSWIFWDPDGCKQKAFQDAKDQTFIRHLPLWMRSYRPGTAQGDGRLGDPERGQTSQHRIYKVSCNSSGHFSLSHSAPKSATTTDQIHKTHSRHASEVAAAVMSGALPDIRGEDYTSTLHRRRAPNGRPRIWCTGSAETDRAAACQLLSSPSENRSPPPILGTAQRTKSCSASRMILSYGKSHSQPISQPQLRASLFLPPRRSEHPTAPFNSLANTGALCNNCQNPSEPRFLQLPLDYLDTSHPYYDMNFVKSLDRRLEQWVDLKPPNPYVSIGHPSCGIDGRNGTPVTIVGSTPSLVSDEHVDLQAYEDEDSIDVAISLSGSSAASAHGVRSKPTTAHEPWYRRTSVPWSERWESNPGPLSITLSQNSQGRFPSTSCISGEAMSDSHASHVSFVKPLERRRLVDRGICVSPPREQEEAVSDDRVINDVIGPNGNKVMTEANQLRTKSDSFLAPILTSSRHHSPHYTTLQGLQFTRDLDSRLERLLYELSPGFRGPKGNLDRLYWGRSPMFLSSFSADVPSRATQATIKRLTYPHRRLQRSISSPAWSSSSHTPSLQSSVGPRAITDDRTNGARGQRREHGSYPNANFSEPDEGAIDVLAWILRRPPQGFQHDDQSPDTFYTGIYGKVRTRAEWENIPSFRRSMVQRLKKVGRILVRKGIGSDESTEEASEGDTLAENSEKTLVNGVDGEALIG